jgi:hypothetical protein
MDGDCLLDEAVANKSAKQKDQEVNYKPGAEALPLPVSLILSFRRLL